MTESVKFPALEPCEEELDNPSEWYYRQVHPTFVSQGIVNPDAFIVDPEAFRSNGGKVSGTRSSKQTPQGAYDEYRRDFPNNLTAGTWGVTLAQVVNVKSRLVDDTKCPPPPGITVWPTGGSPTWTSALTIRPSARRYV
jgi:hypothetical protein